MTKTNEKKPTLTKTKGELTVRDDLYVTPLLVLTLFTLNKLSRLLNKLSVLVCISVADPDHGIHRYLGLLNPDPDPLVRGIDRDPDPDPSIIKQK